MEKGFIRQPNKKKNIVDVLVFRYFSGDIWGPNSKNRIGKIAPALVFYLEVGARSVTN